MLPTTMTTLVELGGVGVGMGGWDICVFLFFLKNFSS